MSSWASAAIAASAVGAVAVGFGIVFVQIPALQHSLFRHRLWELRDEVFWSVADRRIADGPAVEQLLQSIDALIRLAPHMTVVGSLTMRHTLRGVQRDPAVMDVILSQQDLHEREQLAAYVQRVQDLYARHMRAGSPVGWALTVVEKIVTAAERVSPGDHNKAAEKLIGRLNIDVRDLPKVVAPATPSELAACAS